jgi:hypothetical protein
MVRLAAKFGAIARGAADNRDWQIRPNPFHRKIA